MVCSARHSRPGRASEQPRRIPGARRHTARCRPAPRVTEIAPGRVIDGGTWRLTVGGAAQVQPQLAWRVLSDRFGQRLDLLFGRRGTCDALTELARGCDILVHMNTLQRHRAHRRVSRRVRQSPRQRRAGAGGRRENAGADARAAADRSAGVRERIVHEIQQSLPGESSGDRT